METSTRSLRLPPSEAFALAAVALLIVAVDVTPITNNDIFLHLETGEMILETRDVPRVDDFSALEPGRPWVVHEWLAAVVFHLIASVFGLDALIVLKAAVAITVAILLYAAARTSGATPVVAVPMLLLVTLLGAARVMERPHVFTFLMTAAFLLLLARRRSGMRTPLWVFVPLEIAWANLHGGFVFGPVLVALAAAGEAIDAALFRRAIGDGRRGGAEALRLAALALVLSAVPLVNPYGPELFGYVFGHTTSAYTQWIYEWQPPFRSSFRRTYMMRYYVVWIVLGCVVFGGAAFRSVRRRAVPPGGTFAFLTFGFFLALSLRMNRNVTDFALATFPGMAATASVLLTERALVKRREGLVAALGVAGIALAFWFAAHGYPYSPTSRRPFGFGLGENHPVGAAEYLARIGIRGNGFNTYDSGAYLVYRLYPAVRVSMDSRNVQTENAYREYSRALVDRTALEGMLERVDATFVVVEWRKAVRTARLVARLPGWALVHFDDLCAVYLREQGRWSKDVERDRFRVLDPASYSPGRVRLADAEEALHEAVRAAATGAVIGRVMKIDALFALGRREEALDEERRLLAGDPGPDTRIQVGALRFARGDRNGAVAMFRQAAAERPDSRSARRWLEYLERGSDG